METFSYEASTSDGSIVTGTIDAENEKSAVERIQDQGYFPLRVGKEKTDKAVFTDVFSFLKNRIGEKDVMTLTYQLGVLLDSGFPLERALFVVSDLTDKAAMKELIKELLSLVRSGKSFSEALSKFPAVFPVFYVNMIKAGEAGGFLEDTISRMGVYLENSQALKSDVRSALIYPIILVVIGIVVVIVLLTLVIPQFSVIFADLGDALPLPTKIIMNASHMLRAYGWIFIISLIVGVFGLRRYLRSEQGKRSWDNVRFRLPIFGKLFKETIVARFARTLGTLLGSGVPILNALHIVKGTLESERMSQTIASVREDVRKGKGISDPLQRSAIFPSIALYMVKVGEETGKLDEMLMKIADRFELEVRSTIKGMLSLLEPALIVGMAVIVGFIVISMLLAIFSLSEIPF